MKRTSIGGIAITRAHYELEINCFSFVRALHVNLCNLPVKFMVNFDFDVRFLRALEESGKEK